LVHSEIGLSALGLAGLLKVANGQFGTKIKSA